MTIVTMAPGGEITHAALIAITLPGALTRETLHTAIETFRPPGAVVSVAVSVYAQEGPPPYSIDISWDRFEQWLASELGL